MEALTVSRHQRSGATRASRTGEGRCLGRVYGTLYPHPALPLVSTSSIGAYPIASLSAMPAVREGELVVALELLELGSLHQLGLPRTVASEARCSMSRTTIEPEKGGGVGGGEKKARGVDKVAGFVTERKAHFRGLKHVSTCTPPPADFGLRL